MEALIFDMDGVIIDSELHWKTVEGFFIESLVPSWGSADQGRIIGLSVHDLYNMLTEEYELKESKEQFTEQYHGIAAEIYGQKVQLISGFPELLSLLQAKGIKVALASSSPQGWIDIMLDRFALRPAFGAIVSADALHGEGKPSPAIYLHTAKELGVAPETCVVIEDSKNGVLSAKNAGMYCIGFRNGFNEEQDLSSADTIIHAFSELTWDRLESLPAPAAPPPQ